MRGHRQGAETHYETQSHTWIRSLPVQDLAARDEVITAWGFKYKTVAFVWVNQTRTGKWPVTLAGGQWVISNTEPCLLATKGRPQRIERNIKQFVVAERTKHSKKPR
ncbi:S-adenosylmethionine-binding domain-containing protein [Pelotomaculum isophthalicicum JI]|uniref:S-adenosylmethionine-binding domain-containing protein n=1 Tax=Pelotomaculum isophthalicicum JI TaxID=947010 RepID=A0A9X4JVN6_9FIRM|nr:MT-A70 family methyltransferase [Pelotomaculum isophthalicicum]MDF9408681.1 S-adenosylmethionine-binding domain-containing protein [Pelotomaculum isophthalicicum JI]